jgi:predicted aspartyl protease
LIDTGAIYSLALTSTLKKLGICPLRDVDFTLADGTTITCRVGDACFELGGEGGAAPVIFGKESEAVLGATTLGSIGLVLDPFKGRLILMRMLGLTGAAVSKPPGRFGNRPSLSQGISRLALLTRTSFQSHGFAD